ncbi:MAG: hypothetical protein [Olavius algarvensis Delta 4 endosymbiont]|nr:MAG: hypothetical protein [Olavius algarvensis Delta 4 endosymbiont]
MAADKDEAISSFLAVFSLSTPAAGTCNASQGQTAGLPPICIDRFR